jgi:SAM-dependent methyltransferase
MDWYRKFYEKRDIFTHPEEEKAYREKQRSITHREAEDLCRLMDLAPGSRILDVYCGNGRHAVELAQKGFEVTGVDTSFSRITFARNWARDEGFSASFLMGDAQFLPLGRVFEAVVILGGSFTHFLHEEKNISLLRGLRKVLKPGGLLLIDNPNPLRFWRIQHPEGTLADQKEVPYFDFPLGKGKTGGYVRYYGIDRMISLFKEADLDVQGILGSREGKSYTVESPRMIIIGQAQAA